MRETQWIPGARSGLPAYFRIFGENGEKTWVCANSDPLETHVPLRVINHLISYAEQSAEWRQAADPYRLPEDLQLYLETSQLEEAISSSHPQDVALPVYFCWKSEALTILSRAFHVITSRFLAAASRCSGLLNVTGFANKALKYKYSPSPTIPGLSSDRSRLPNET